MCRHRPLKVLIPSYAAAFVLLYIGVTYGLDRTYQFAGDQGANADIVRDMYVNGEFPLLGPKAGFGGRYFGPVYFYVLFIPYWLFDFDPLAGGYFVAFFNLLGFGLLCLYLSTRFSLGLLPLIAFGCMALLPPSFLVLRTQWNPNLLPGITCLLFVVALSYANSSTRNSKILYGGLLGLLVATALQLHTTTFCMVPTVAGLFLLDIQRGWKTNRDYKSPLLALGAAAGTAAFVFVPTLMDGMASDWDNIRRYMDFIQKNSRGVLLFSSSLTEPMRLLYGFWQSAFGDIIGAFYFGLLLPFLLGFCLYRWYRHKSLDRVGLFILLNGSLIGFFLVGFANYQKEISDYFHILFMPIPFLVLLIVPLLAGNTKSKDRLMYAVGIFLVLNMGNYLYKDYLYLKNRPNRLDHYDLIHRIVDTIGPDAPPFPFGVGFQEEGERSYAGHLIYLLKWKSQDLLAPLPVSIPPFPAVIYTVAPKGEQILFKHSKEGFKPEYRDVAYSFNLDRKWNVGDFEIRKHLVADIEIGDISQKDEEWKRVVIDKVVGTYQQVASILLQMGRLNEAIPIYQKILELDADNIPVRLNLGQSLYQRSRYEDAIGMYQSVLDRAPNGFARFNLATAYLAKGDVAIARHTFVQGIDEYGVEKAVQLGMVTELEQLIERDLSREEAQSWLARLSPADI
jgi:tetratricopeptide (TPR) repeat protein